MSLDREIIRKLLEDHVRHRGHHATTKLGKFAVHNHVCLADQIHALVILHLQRGGELHRSRGTAFVSAFAQQTYLFGVHIDTEHFDVTGKGSGGWSHFDLNRAFVMGLINLLGDRGTGHAGGQFGDVGQHLPASLLAGRDGVLLVNCYFHSGYSLGATLVQVQVVFFEFFPGSKGRVWHIHVSHANVGERVHHGCRKGGDAAHMR